MIKPYFEIVCDNCGLTASFDAPSGAALRRHVVCKLGWSRQKRGGKMVDICPACIKAAGQPKMSIVQREPDLFHRLGRCSQCKNRYHLATTPAGPLDVTTRCPFCGYEERFYNMLNTTNFIAGDGLLTIVYHNIPITPDSWCDPNRQARYETIAVGGDEGIDA